MNTFTRETRHAGLTMLFGGCCLILAEAAAHAGDIAAGREKAKACAVCHGIDGLALRPDTPHIAGQSEIYMRDQLERYRAQRRVHPEMNIIASDLSDKDIADLVAYYSAVGVTADVPR